MSRAPELRLPCHANGVADRDVRKGNPCDGVTLPVVTTGPHAATMGIHFYTGTMFPAEYRNVAFVHARARGTAPRSSAMTW